MRMAIVRLVSWMLTALQIDVLINNAGLPGSITYPAWDPNDCESLEKQTHFTASGC